MELAKYCAEMCHVLKDVTQGVDASSLSGPRKKAIEDLGRYADLVYSSPLMITSDIRTMNNIRFTVSECQNCACDLREESLIAWRMELREVLRILDVSDSQSTVLPQILNRLRGTWCRTVPAWSVKLSHTWRGPLAQKPQRPFL